MIGLNIIGEIWGKKSVICPEEILVVDALWYGGGAFCNWGTLLLSFTSSKMNSNDFVSVLNTHLLPFLRFRRKKYIFQLDNASIYTSSSTSQCFSANHIEVVKWPACLPDLNPMENLYGIRVREIYANNKQFHSTYPLKAAILNVWSKTEAKTTRNIAHSMNNRIFQLNPEKWKCNWLQKVCYFSYNLCFSLW